MIEVYKTNIEKRKAAKRVRKLLHQKFPDLLINFDLEDCDNIMRVENPKGHFDVDLILNYVSEMGFYVEILEEIPIVKDLSDSQVRSIVR